MFFPDKKKALGSILDGFDKYKKEKSGKMEFSEAPGSHLAQGGDVEDEDHMEALAAHSEAMHDAHKRGDHKAHAHALKAFLHEHETHEKMKESKEELSHGGMTKHESK